LYRIIAAFLGIMIVTNFIGHTLHSRHHQFDSGAVPHKEMIINKNIKIFIDKEMGRLVPEKSEYGVTYKDKEGNKRNVTCTEQQFEEIKAGGQVIVFEGKVQIVLPSN